MFAAITPMLAVGALAERGRLGPVPIFVFAWSTLVYDPIACWTWSANGWSFIMGGLDFAGGTPVHISSGTAALAISIYLGKRKGWGTERLSYKPHNTSFVILGQTFSGHWGFAKANPTFLKAPCCSGLGGSASTVVVPSAPT